MGPARAGSLNLSSQAPVGAEQSPVAAASLDPCEPLRSGGQKALAEEFTRHRERLLRMIQWRLDPRLAGRVDADDILQEAFLDASARLELYLRGPKLAPFLWLRGIVGQTLINVYRRHLGADMRDAGRERRRFSAPGCDATSMSIAAHLVAHLTSPSQAAMRLELAASLEQALEDLKPADREILVMRHFEELTNSEVAESLQIAPKAASIRYIRAVARLKDVLDKFPSLFG